MKNLKIFPKFLKFPLKIFLLFQTIISLHRSDNILLILINILLLYLLC